MQVLSSISYPKATIVEQQLIYMKLKIDILILHILKYVELDFYSRISIINRDN